MPKTMKEIKDEFDAEAKVIEEALPCRFIFSEFLMTRGMPGNFTSFVEIIAPVYVERGEGPKVLAQRFKDNLISSMNTFIDDLDKYIKERNNDGTEDTVHSEV